MKNSDENLHTKFNKLVIDHHSRIYALFRKMVGNHEEADDLTQITFIKAYKNYSKFQGQSSFYTWLYRIAVNTGINHIRKIKLRSFIGLENLGNEQAHYDKPIDRESTKILQEAISNLPAKQYMIVLLRSFQELSFKEISAVMEISENSAKVNFSHAVKNLRDILTKMEVSYEIM